jgi:membrane protein oxaA 1
LSRVEFLKVGHFLWLDMSATDPTFILPVLAAVFTFFSTWLSNKAMPEKNGGMTAMMYAMPVMIFFFAMYSASGVALYWVVSNAYQVGQTYLLNNPFKIIAAREAEQQAIKDLEKQKRRAFNKAQKKKN